MTPVADRVSVQQGWGGPPWLTDGPFKGQGSVSVRFAVCQVWWTLETFFSEKGHEMGHIWSKSGFLEAGLFLLVLVLFLI